VRYHLEAVSIVGGCNDELVEKDTKTHAARRASFDAGTPAERGEHEARCRDRTAVCGAKVVRAGSVFSDEADSSAPWRPNRVTLAFGKLCRQYGVDGVR
jgi:hypothetical protein